MAQESHNIQKGAPDERRPVILVHGIRTEGRWIEELAAELEQHGLEPEPFYYGFFGALQLLWPGARDKKVELFRKRYEEVSGQYDILPSVVAHSFGSYIVTRCIEKYGVEFHRIVLCGSIVRVDYPWTQVINGRGAEEVLNDIGRADFWSGAVGYVVSDAGPSGREGFRDLADGLVHRRDNRLFRHSDFFHLRNFRDNWLPFLKGEKPKRVKPIREPGFNWRFATTLSVLSALVLASLLWWVLPSGEEEDVWTDEQRQEIQRERSEDGQTLFVVPYKSAVASADDQVEDFNGSFEQQLRHTILSRLQSLNTDFDMANLGIRRVPEVLRPPPAYTEKERRLGSELNALAVISGVVKELEDGETGGNVVQIDSSYLIIPSVLGGQLSPVLISESGPRDRVFESQAGLPAARWVTSTALALAAREIESAEGQPQGLCRARALLAATQADAAPEDAESVQYIQDMIENIDTEIPEECP